MDLSKLAELAASLAKLPDAIQAVKDHAAALHHMAAVTETTREIFLEQLQELKAATKTSPGLAFLLSLLRQPPPPEAPNGS